VPQHLAALYQQQKVAAGAGGIMMVVVVGGGGRRHRRAVLLDDDDAYCSTLGLATVVPYLHWTILMFAAGFAVALALLVVRLCLASYSVAAWYAVGFSWFQCRCQC
jgi:hypothetical protein